MTIKTTTCSAQLLGFLLFVFFAVNTCYRQVAAEDTVDVQTLIERDMVSNPTSEMFNPNQFLDIEIEISEQDWDLLRFQHHDLVGFLSEKRLENPSPMPYTYLRADVTINGQKIKSVGIRKKGFLGSGSFTRPSLKIKFHHYVKDQQFEGIRRMTLNNNAQDSSQIDQYLTYQIFSSAGVPAPRCNFARVTVNGKYLGIYSHVEPIGKPFLLRHFANSDGNLYEGIRSDFRPVWVQTFQKKTNKKNPSRSDLEAVVKALLSDNEVLFEKLDSLIDIDEFVTFWAAEVMTGHWDGYCDNMNNYYLYHNSSSGKFHFIPWGADQAFGSQNPFRRYQPPESVKAEGILARRLYNLPKTRQKYRTRLAELLATVWNENLLLAEIDRVESLLKGSIHVSQSQFETDLGKVRDYIRERRKAIQAELDEPARVWEFPLTHSLFIRQRGEVTGQFTSTWSQHPFENGKAELTVIRDGQHQQFTQIGVSAVPQQGDYHYGYPTLTYFGLREGEEKWLLVSLIIEPEKFAKNPSLAIDGYLTSGWLVELNPNTNQIQVIGFLSGTLNLSEASTKEDGPVSGNFVADIYWWGD